MSPAGTVQDNKAKRQERLKLRFRDLTSSCRRREMKFTPKSLVQLRPRRQPKPRHRAPAPQNGTRKSGKENKFPGTKTSRGRLKTPKLQESKTNDGPSFPRVSAQRMPFADQLAAAINSTKTSTPFPTS
ncbi:hypothetical protein BGW80DRAFT_1301330 [Lactifluus volemus]|nr:hypothetical protein BGW80DRAFT_1301330 [Lactifluus volemus]